MSPARDFDPAADMRLHDDERVLLSTRRSGWRIVLGKVVTLGLFTFWWRACWIVVTDQRLYVKQGILNKSELSLPMRFIQDASVHRSWLGVGEVALSTAGGDESISRLYPLTANDARQLSDVILAQAHARWDPDSSPQR